MIRHIVLYRFKAGVPQADIAAIFTKLSQLKDLVKGVEDFQWGESIGASDKNAGYQYAITVDVCNAAVFAEYSPHPLHVEVRQQMQPLLEGNLLMFDFNLA